MRYEPLDCTTRQLDYIAYLKRHRTGQNIVLAYEQVKVANIPGKKLEHQGIKVQLIGQIELATERGHPHDFVNLGEISTRCLGAWAPIAHRLKSHEAICDPGNILNTSKVDLYSSPITVTH